MIKYYIRKDIKDTSGTTTGWITSREWPYSYYITFDGWVYRYNGRDIAEQLISPGSNGTYRWKNVSREEFLKRVMI